MDNTINLAKINKLKALRNAFAIRFNQVAIFTIWNSKNMDEMQAKANALIALQNRAWKVEQAIWREANAIDAANYAAR